MDFSPRTKSNLICSGSEDGTILMWDTRTNRIARTFDGGHDGAVYCARWSPDGAMIASGSADAKVTKLCTRQTPLSLSSDISSLVYCSIPILRCVCGSQALER